MIQTMTLEIGLVAVNLPIRPMTEDGIPKAFPRNVSCQGTFGRMSWVSASPTIYDSLPKYPRERGFSAAHQTNWRTGNKYSKTSTYGHPTRKRMESCWPVLGRWDNRVMDMNHRIETSQCKVQARQGGPLCLLPRVEIQDPDIGFRSVSERSTHTQTTMMEWRKSFRGMFPYELKKAEDIRPWPCRCLGDRRVLTTTTRPFG